jgi:hypothetical protein
MDGEQSQMSMRMFKLNKASLDSLIGKPPLLEELSFVDEFLIFGKIFMLQNNLKNKGYQLYMSESNYRGLSERILVVNPAVPCFDEKQSNEMNRNIYETCRSLNLPYESEEEFMDPTGNLY